MIKKNKMIYEFHKKDINEIGVFVSYTHKDIEYFNSFTSDMKKDGINILSDELISAGVEDFHKVIKDLLVRSTCAVVLYSDTLTPWMLYEIGVLKGMNKKIYIYSLQNNPIPNYLSDCKIVDSIDQLKEKCKQNTLYYDMYENDSHMYNKDEYNKTIKNKTKYVSLKIKVPGIEKIDSSAFQFRFLMIGMFKMERHTEKDYEICAKIGEELEYCECSCYNNYKQCPFNTNGYPDNKKEIVILNKIYDSIKLDYDEIEYLIPLNNQYGVTFKCFVDIKDFSLKDQIVDLLINAGVMSAKESGSAVQDRIYFAIPKKPNQGLFEIYTEEGFTNNYFCPGVLE